MRALMKMDTIQIEITNACNHRCGNCTRFCSLVRRPYFMPLDEVKRAIDSMLGYPKMTGIMGGEPLLHPDFEAICRYAAERIPKRQLGLWTTLPRGYEKYARLICDTFEHIFVNDHSREDVYHQPPLIASREVFRNEIDMWQAIDGCWLQESWSAAINPRGAWFCEIAAAMSILFGEGDGWPIDRGWWARIPKDFTAQMERFCPRCGFPCRTSLRSSREELDDISPLNYEALRDKVRNPDRLNMVQPIQAISPQPQMAAYKDMSYRRRIAARYGMGLYINDMGFWTPYMDDSRSGCVLPDKSIYETYRERFGARTSA